jgi:hypothetical protein
MKAIGLRVVNKQSENVNLNLWEQQPQIQVGIFNEI